MGHCDKLVWTVVEDAVTLIDTGNEYGGRQTGGFHISDSMNDGDEILSAYAFVIRVANLNEI